MSPFVQIQKPSISAFQGRRVFGHIGFQPARIALVLPIVGEFAREEKSVRIFHIEGKTEDFVAYGQPVMEGDKTLVGAVLDVAWSANCALGNALG